MGFGRGPAEKADPGNAMHVAAPFLGTVTVLARPGRRVAAGETVATIEAMKMEAAITAPRAGTVARVAVDGTRPVEGGDLVLELSPSTNGSQVTGAARRR